MSKTSNITPLRPSISCPQCHKPSQRLSYPFCSSRCADLDLGKWLNGSYRIASDEAPDETENGTEPS